MLHPAPTRATNPTKNDKTMASDKKPGTDPKTGKQFSQGGNQPKRNVTKPPQEGEANTTAPQPGNSPQGAETTQMDKDNIAQTDDQRSVDSTQDGSRGRDKDPFTGATRHPANSGSDDRADHGNVDPSMTDEDQMDKQGPVNKSGGLATNPTDRNA